MALPPFFKTVWLTHELTPVENPRHIELLARRYAPDARDAGGRDFNLNARRWQRVARLNIPELGYWADFCGTARVRAEEILRVEADLARNLDKPTGTRRRSIMADSASCGRAPGTTARGVPRRNTNCYSRSVCRLLCAMAYARLIFASTQSEQYS